MKLKVKSIERPRGEYWQFARARGTCSESGDVGLVQNLDSGLWTGLMDWTVD